MLNPLSQLTAFRAAAAAAVGTGVLVTGGLRFQSPCTN
jgi:hypothetical protein